MRNEIKKLKVFINLSWLLLFGIWLIQIMGADKINVIVQNEKLIQLGNFVDSNIYLRNGWSFITYYFNMIFIVYSIFKKKIFSFNQFKYHCLY